MNQTSQILQATRLFSHLDDLCSLGDLTQRECLILQTALTTLITSLHAVVQGEPAALPAMLPARSYVVQVRKGTGGLLLVDHLLVRVAGQKDRTLRHVSIFCLWGFGCEGYAARDTALAILADLWGEMLSRRGFASGQPRYCQDYLAVAELVTKKLRRGGVLSAAELATFLQQKRETAPDLSDSLRSRENKTRGDASFRLSALPTIPYQGGE